MRMSFFDWFRMQRQPAPRVRVQRPRRPPGRKPVKWVVSLPKGWWDVVVVETRARTKSEARSIAKKALRLKRLPVGTVCRRAG